MEGRKYSLDIITQHQAIDWLFIWTEVFGFRSDLGIERSGQVVAHHFLLNFCSYSTVFNLLLFAPLNSLQDLHHFLVEDPGEDPRGSVLKGDETMDIPSAFRIIPRTCPKEPQHRPITILPEVGVEDRDNDPEQDVIVSETISPHTNLVNQPTDTVHPDGPDRALTH